MIVNSGKTNMHIDSYKFGEIVIDSRTYRKDCLILGGVVRPNWWREEGHSLSMRDLREIIEAKPVILVIGCGASGIMDVPENTQQELTKLGIKVEIYDTQQAVTRFNELAKSGENTAAALHLTC
jgi:hypothetical protein